MPLKLRASRRTSGGPCPAADRVSSAPPPSRWAAASRELSGRLTHRASAIAATAAAASPARATAASQVHRTLTCSSSSWDDLDSTTAPTTELPSSPGTGAVTRSRSSTLLSTTVRPRSADVSAAAGTAAAAPPVPVTRRRPALYTRTCSPARRACARTRATAAVPAGGRSASWSSARPASARADRMVSCRKELPS